MQIRFEQVTYALRTRHGKVTYISLERPGKNHTSHASGLFLYKYKHNLYYVKRCVTCVTRTNIMGLACKICDIGVTRS